MKHLNALDERQETARALWRPFLLAALPVTLAGGLAVWIGVHVLRQSTDPGGWAFLGIGAIFATIGLAYSGILLFGWVKLRRGDFDLSDDTEGPLRPWQLRQDWARGEVRSETRSEFYAALATAIFASVVATIAVISVWPQNAAPQGIRWLVLLFPLGAVILILRSLYLGWRWLKYGASHLRLQTVPLRPGRVLEGVVHIPRRIHPAAGFTVRFACVKKVTSRRNKRQRVDEKTLWQVEQSVPGEALESGPDGVRFPVAFQIPATWPSSSQHGNTEILWRLQASARTSGVNYAATFVLPVFGPQLETE